MSTRTSIYGLYAQNGMPVVEPLIFEQFYDSEAEVLQAAKLAAFAADKHGRFAALIVIRDDGETCVFTIGELLAASAEEEA